MGTLQQLKEANVNDSASATFEVLAANAQGKYRIRYLLISVDTADTITIKDGSTTRIGPLYFSANGGLSQEFGEVPLRNFTDNTALQITKGTAGTGCTVYCQYELV